MDWREGWGRRLAPYKLEFFFFILAVILYLPGIDWGLPYATGPDRVYVWAYDDLSPRAALREVYQTLAHSTAERWLAYPLQHHFLLVAAYSPYFVWLKLNGQFLQPSGVYPFGLVDPVSAFRVITLIARLVSVFMAAGCVMIAYLIGSILWDKKTGILAATITLLAYPMFYYTKTANLEVPYLFWTSLGLLVFARILTSGMSVKRAAWLGVFAGLATATKDQAAGFFILMPVVLAPIYIRDWKAARISKWRPLLTLLIAGSVTYALGSGLVLDPERYFMHLKWLFGSEGMLAQEFVDLYSPSLRYPSTVFGAFGLTLAVLSALLKFLGPVILAVGCYALIQVALHEPKKLAFGLPALGYFVFFILPYHWFFLRYAIPLAFVFGVYAARGMVMILGAMERFRLARVAFIGLAFAWPICLCLYILFQMQMDARYAAAEWLAAQMAQGDSIANCANTSALPRLREDVHILELEGGTAAISQLAEERPEFVLMMPDWSSTPGMRYSRYCTDELYQKLMDGSLGYHLVAEFGVDTPGVSHLLDYPSVNPPVQIFEREEQ